VQDFQNKPLSKVYIKTFIKLQNSTQFYKDGYTDLGGRFDFASSNSDILAQVLQFSILICSENLGSMTKVCNKPSGVGNFAKAG
jgi:hypothetical protein